MNVNQISPNAGSWTLELMARNSARRTARLVEAQLLRLGQISKKADAKCLLAPGQHGWRHGWLSSWSTLVLFQLAVVLFRGSFVVLLLKAVYKVTFRLCLSPIQAVKGRSHVHRPSFLGDTCTVIIVANPGLIHLAVDPGLDSVLLKTGSFSPSSTFYGLSQHLPLSWRKRQHHRHKQPRRLNVVLIVSRWVPVPSDLSLLLFTDEPLTQV